MTGRAALWAARVARCLLALAACAASLPTQAAQAPAPSSGHHSAAKTTHAAAKPAHRPRKTGSFGDWRLAESGVGASHLCYAYTRAQSSPALPGRGEVALTVTERPALRDAVAISAGVDLPERQDIPLRIGTTPHPFYPAGRQLFARDPASVLAAMAKAASASLSLSLPGKPPVTDRFSLEGFSAALAAARAACPAAKP